MKKKVLKIFIFLIIIIALVFLFITIYKYSVISKLCKLDMKNNELTNFYFLEERNSYTTEVWRKDNLLKAVMKSKTSNFEVTMWGDLNTNTGYTIYNNSNEYTNHGIVSSLQNLKSNLFYDTDTKNYDESFFNRLKNAVNSNISIIKYNDKKCYQIFWGLYEEIIEKDTGLVLKMDYHDEDETQITYSYSLNTVTYEDVKVPDITEYTYLEKKS